MQGTQRSWAGAGAVSHHLLPSTFPFPILRVKATGCFVLWASPSGRIPRKLFSSSLALQGTEMASVVSGKNSD